MKCVMVFLFGVFTFSAYSIKPDRKYIRYPQHQGLIYKSLEVKTPDDYGIATWYFPAQDRLGEHFGSETPLPYRTLDTKKRPTLIICNADAGNMSYFQLVLAACYTVHGYNAVTFDWRGFGESDVFPMDSDYFCYTEMLSDYEAVIAATVEQPETDAGHVYLLGWSTGGYLSMITAYRNPSVRGCVVRGVPTSFEDVIPIIKKEKGKTDENLLVPDDFPVECMPFSVAPVFDKDIMLVVGSEDTRTPVWMAEKIMARLPADILKRIWVAEGAKHGGKDAPEFLYLEDFVSRTVQFLQDSQANKR